ncbi:efflux RND transporter permease subunit [Lacisediminimonas profundi]|uniref:efflux RND transporter permease subunit n=1 Tax=Lacisediminimonas profundi TaxID=2603856 RepID=UPI00124B6002|nr:CusA/CzcA family heavy metal efflux RND transporter [Lacisediminimonas profundi]
MLDRLVAFALSQRLLVLVLAAMMIAAGVQAFRGLPIDAFPDVSSTQVKIVMKAPGMTPEEVETRITVPIEQELLGIPHQHILRSQSKYALADITLDFDEGTDIYWARQQVAERLNSVLADLPPGATGGLAPITTPLGEMVMFTIEGNLSLAEKRTLLDWTIRPRLRSIPGVAEVNALGGLVRSFEVVPDPAALAARRLSLAQLQAALELNNRNDGAGRVNENEESLLVRADGSIRTLGDVKAIAVAERNGVAIRVGDVAQVRFGALTRYGNVTHDGRSEAVEGLVLGLRGANAQLLVNNVRARLAEIEKTLPSGTTLSTFYDRGNLVERAVSTVSRGLMEAIVLVMILLFLFLGNLRAALVVAAILPLSALFTFVLMRSVGLSANLMSLGGLAIAIGLLVDAAVVVVENIESHQAHQGHQGGRGVRSRLNLIFRSVQEVAVPVFAGMLIIGIVFVPLMTLEGLEGKMFSPVALTIVFALSSSLLLSLTVIPVLASFFLGKGTHTAPRWVGRLEQRYVTLLVWVLGRRRRVYAAAGVALLAAVAVFPYLGKSFMPTMDEGDLIMQIEKLPSISLQRSTEIDLMVQRRILAAVPDVAGIVARTGADELGLDPMGLNETDTFLLLKPRDQWKSASKEELIDAVRAVTSEFPGMNFSFTQPIEMRTSEMLSGVRGDLAIKIFGPDLPTLGKLAAQIAVVLKAIPGSEEILTTRNSGVQYLQVEIDRQAAGRLGMTVEQIQNDLRMLVEGRRAGVVIEQGRRLPLLVRGEAGQLTAESFRSLRLPREDGEPIMLSSVAQLKMLDGPVKVERENASRMSVVRANVRNRDLVGFVDEARAKVASQVPLPAGYHITWGGQFENQQRAAARLMVVVPVALALIYLLLFTTLGSLRQATLVLMNIPFALVGGVFALGISGEYLSVPASVGFIALMGIAVLNGLVMLTCFNQLAARGADRLYVVTEGARRRLRPVLMTATIAAFGLVPLLLATGPGSEIQRPLAIVVIGGLISATLLTLVLLPALFQQFGWEKK